MNAIAEIDRLPRRPVYRTEYEALGRQHAFDDESVELLDGQIVYAAEEGPPHAAVAARLARLVIESIPAEHGEVRIGNPIALSDLSEPEPDLFVTTPRHSYRAAHPTTATLVIEVSQTSRRRDLGVKATLYAAAGIPDYWVVDLTRDRVVVHRDPSGSRFRSVTSPDHGILRPLHHPDVQVDVIAVLP
ncbi:MAG: Uma2 family endonuclease [Actinobacteria bacterium]|nr:Uma2 family endonuclease [Actinomycetota bacterium]